MNKKSPNQSQNRKRKHNQISKDDVTESIFRFSESLNKISKRNNDEIFKNIDPEKTYRIYADGIFDLFHYGHSRFLKQCKELLPKTFLLVGVCDDALTHHQKGKTVLNSAERVESVRHCRWVDQVVEHAPWKIDQSFLKKHKIDFVAHDDIPYQTKSENDVYAFVKKNGRFIATKRTESISTSDIITRVVKDYDGFVRRNLKKGYTRQEMNVGFLKEKKLKMTGKMGEVKTKVEALRSKVKDKSDDVLDHSKIILERWYNNSHKFIDDFLKKFNKKVISIENKIKTKLSSTEFSDLKENSKSD